MELIYLIITGLSILASILAWIAKLKWSKEYQIAKEAQISSLNQQIELSKTQNEQLKEFKSDKIISLYKSTKEGLEILNDKILGEKKDLEKKVEDLESRIEDLVRINEKSIPVLDFSEISIASKEIAKSIHFFSKNYSTQFNEISKSLENFKHLNLERTNISIDLSEYEKN